MKKRLIALALPMIVAGCAHTAPAIVDLETVRLNIDASKGPLYYAAEHCVIEKASGSAKTALILQSPKAGTFSFRYAFESLFPQEILFDMEMYTPTLVTIRFSAQDQTLRAVGLRFYNEQEKQNSSHWVTVHDWRGNNGRSDVNQYLNDIAECIPQYL